MSQAVAGDSAMGGRGLATVRAAWRWLLLAAGVAALLVLATRLPPTGAHGTGTQLAPGTGVPTSPGARPAAAVDRLVESGPAAAPAAPAARTARSGPESVPSAVQGVVNAVGHAGGGAGFPLLLVVVVLGFLLVQNRIDRRDPKLAFASITAEDTVEFQPPPGRGEVRPPAAPAVER
ncbi:MAG TPA: hypothetical protein VFT62_03320 [Mycobacteriales bacterium]|nr:hypothetical protein [Mycobacteriales bacterium]